jgi:hypothetical protein
LGNLRSPRALPAETGNPVLPAGKEH